MARRREVRYETRRHGVVLARPFARALALVGAGIALVVVGEPVAWALGALGGAIAAFGALVAFRAVLAWDRTKVLVTDDELLVVHGVVRRRTAAVDLGPGTALVVEQSILGRLLGYGTVVAGELEIPHVPDPRRLRRLAA